MPRLITVMSFAICVFAEFSFLFGKLGNSRTYVYGFKFEIYEPTPANFYQPASCQRSVEVTLQLLLNGKVNIKVAPDE